VPIDLASPKQRQWCRLASTGKALALVIQDNDKPLAVLLKYEHFLAMQEKILKCQE
jgi:hypothetical protein